MSIEDIIADMQRCVDMRRAELQGTRGMSVPYSGPLRSAVPSVLKDVQWWVDRLKEASCL